MEPYALEYPGSAQHLATARLAAETGLWRDVHDFCWLRATPSPNWRASPGPSRLLLLYPFGLTSLMTSISALKRFLS